MERMKNYRPVNKYLNIYIFILNMSSYGNFVYYPREIEMNVQ